MPDSERLRHSVEHYKRLSGQLQHALDSRVPIEQAEAVLAERYGLDVGRGLRAAALVLPSQQHRTPRRRGRRHSPAEGVS